MLVVTKLVLTSMAKAMRSSLLAAGIQSRHQECLEEVISFLGCGNHHQVLQALGKGPLLVRVDLDFLVNPYGRPTDFGLRFRLGAGITQLDRFLAGRVPVRGRPVDPGMNPLLLEACLSLSDSSLHLLGTVQTGRVLVERGGSRAHGTMLSLENMVQALASRGLPVDVAMQCAVKVTNLALHEGSVDGSASFIDYDRLPIARLSLSVNQHGPVRALCLLILEDMLLANHRIDVREPAGHVVPLTLGNLFHPSTDVPYGEVSVDDVRAWCRDYPKTRRFVYEMLSVLLANGLSVCEALKVLVKDPMLLPGPGGDVGRRFFSMTLARVMLGHTLGSCLHGFLPWHEVLLVDVFDTAGNLETGLDHCTRCVGFTADDHKEVRAFLLLMIGSMAQSGASLPDVLLALSRKPWTELGDRDGYAASCLAHIRGHADLGHDLGTATREIYPAEEWRQFGVFIHLDSSNERLLVAAERLLIDADRLTSDL